MIDRDTIIEVLNVIKCGKTPTQVLPLKEILLEYLKDRGNSEQKSKELYTLLCSLTSLNSNILFKCINGISKYLERKYEINKVFLPTGKIILHY